MKTLMQDDIEYPKLLKKTKNAPKELYVEGSINCFNMPCVTVVGSRNMSEYGKRMTKKIVKELVNAGVCIVSGLAIGIDTVAHETCLENGGKTIAVLGSGLYKVFPSENVNLFNRIINSGGCVMSEQMPDEEAKKVYFPARNRIVSGLSLATVVIEAAYRSGTSITAKFAFEQGRKVFCIPNSVGSKNSCGTINLLKKGATMITDGREILCSLGLIDEIEDYEEFVEKQRMNKDSLLEKEQLDELDNNARNIYQYIKENVVGNSEIMCRQLNMSIQDVNMYLTVLELKGLVVSKSGGNYCIESCFRNSF